MSEQAITHLRERIGGYVTALMVDERSVSACEKAMDEALVALASDLETAQQERDEAQRVTEDQAARLGELTRDLAAAVERANTAEQERDRLQAGLFADSVLGLSRREVGLAIDGVAPLVRPNTHSEYRPLLHKLQAAYKALASSVQNPSVCSRCAGTDPDCYICAQFAPAVQEPR